MRRVRTFLEFISGRIGPHLEGLQADHVSQFIRAHARMAPRTAAALIGLLRCFLSFLYAYQIVPQDLSLSLPKIRIPEHAHIPLVWTREQVDALLSAIDRNGVRGKRDYAILLLACRLGLRSKDIRQLLLENLRWAQSRIEITQSKTGRSLTLPILGDVGDALVDYLRNGRPNSPFRQVFLNIRAPFKPIAYASALADGMKSYLKRAGVSIPKQGGVGLHSLRHTLATRMLEGNIPLPTISEVLGHRTTESTLIYTKVDISALRSASLDPDGMVPQEVPDA
jgi:integrase